nr:hypothetical protein [Tanacetum cinerariifolium]
MVDSKLARRVYMSCPTGLICSGSGGTGGGGGDGSSDVDTHGGSDGEGDLDLLRDKDGKSDGGGKDDDDKAGMRSDDGGTGLTGKVVISSLESNMMTNGTSTPKSGVVARK